MTLLVFGSRLFRLEPQDARYRGMVDDITTGQNQQVYHTETCPKQVIWQEVHGHYIQGRNLFSVADDDRLPNRHKNWPM